MPRTPHTRTTPPAPKERPVSLSATGSVRTTPPQAGPSPQAGGSAKDFFGVWVFTGLVLLGLIVTARAFLVM